jgi:hypothetical protein
MELLRGLAGVSSSAPQRGSLHDETAPLQSITAGRAPSSAPRKHAHYQLGAASTTSPNAVVMTPDAVEAETYERDVGRYVCTIDGVRYTFSVTRVSARYTDEAGVPTSRKYTLSLSRGGSNFSSARDKWPSLALDYTSYMKSRDTVKIDYLTAPRPGEAGHISLEPALPKGGTIRVLVPIAVRLCENFFPGAELLLQDAATTDLNVLDGNNVDNPRIYLSGAKIMRGTSRYTAYGELGFYSPDRDQDRLDSLQRFYRTHTLRRAFELIETSDPVLAYFVFDDIITTGSRFGRPEKFLEEYRAQLVAWRGEYERVAKELGALEPDEDTLITSVAGALCTIVETSRNEDEKRNARRAFHSMQACFLGFFFFRLQTLLVSQWETYAKAHGVSALGLLDEPVDGSRMPRDIEFVDSGEHLRSTPQHLRRPVLEALAEARAEVRGVVSTKTPPLPRRAAAPSPSLYSYLRSFITGS